MGNSSPNSSSYNSKTSKPVPAQVRLTFTNNKQQKKNKISNRHKIGISYFII